MKNHPPTVDFVVPAESVHTVVTLLLSHKISFTLISSDYSGTQMASNYDETMPNEHPSLAAKSNESDDLLRGTTHEENVIKEIYRKYIIEHIEHTPPQEAQIAAEFRMNLLKFKSMFRATYGKPFYQLYMDKRMEHAAKLLKRGYKAIEVSRRIGYGEKSCIKFNKMFQKHFGITPKKYQLSHFGRIDRRIG